MIRVPGAICLILAAGCLNAGNDAFDAWRSGQYQKAAKMSLDSSLTNNAMANYYIGKMYLYGYGQLRNTETALRYISKSAEAGYLPAANIMGRLALQDGNYDKAYSWFKKAADGGDVLALLYVAAANSNGFGVKANSDVARRYYLAAARQGNAVAQYEMAAGFLREKKMTSKKAGLAWLNKALEKGNLAAKLKLAELYLSGGVVEKNPERARELIASVPINNNLYLLVQLAEVYKNAHDEVNLESINNKIAELDKDRKPAVVDAKAKVIMTLSEGKALTFADCGLAPSGIFTAWYNSNALQNEIYNAAPMMHQISQRAFIMPQFTMIEPNAVSISDYYEAITHGLAPANVKKVAWPRYELPQLPNTPVSKIPAIGPESKRIKNNIIETLEHGAVLGNADAQFKLGQIYQYGLGGVKQDIDVAIKFYSQAASQKDLRAEYSLGVLHLSEGEYQEAFAWLNDAAFKGNAYAQYVLGRINEEGYYDNVGNPIVSQNPAQALSMYALSAANNFGPAQYVLAEVMMRNKPANLTAAAREEHFAEVKRLYEAAKNSGVAEAGLPLAFFYAMDPARYSDALALANHEAKAGNHVAALLLGLIYDRGLSVRADAAEARYWYKKAENTPAGAFIMGTIYVNGAGVTEDHARGMELLQRAANSGFANAWYNLAIGKYKNDANFVPDLEKAMSMGNGKAALLLADYYLQQSSGDQHKMQEAFNIYRDFAERGERNAEVKLGYMYEHGLGVGVDMASAEAWYQRAALQNQTFGQYFLGNLYQFGKLKDKPDYDLAKKYYAEAAPNYAPAAVALGFINETIDENYSEAQKYYEMAAARGDAVAGYNLGLIYELGKGIPVDYDKAQQNFMNAALKNNARAMTALANLYFSDQSGLRDENQAISWYRRAADLGDSEAAYQMGLLSEIGFGMEPDYNAAVKYYERAGNNGNAKARLALARMYRYGLGVNSNLELAEQYYKEQAALNNGYAQYQLATLNNLAAATNGAVSKESRKMMEQAAANGSAQARRILQWLNSQAGARVSYIEPAIMRMVTTGKSVDHMYLEALNLWNNGKEMQSWAIIDKIRQKYPRHAPVKRVYQQINQPALRGLTVYPSGAHPENTSS